MNYLQDVYFANLNIVYNVGGYFSIAEDEDWSTGKHKFNQCKFYYVIDGECVVNCKGKDYLLQAGDWMFIPAMTEHSYYNVKSGVFKKYWAHFELYPDLSLFHSLNLPYKVNVGIKGEVFKLFKKLERSSQSNKVTDKLTVKSCLLSLLNEFVKASSVGNVEIRNHGSVRLNDVLSFINDNLSCDLSVSLLADKYFTHPNHFIRAFKEKTGYTPANYVKQKRLEKAKQLLENTELSIFEISEMIGINDISHFSRDFKTFYGLSPLKYRKYYTN